MIKYVSLYVSLKIKDTHTISNFFIAFVIKTCLIHYMLQVFMVIFKHHFPKYIIKLNKYSFRWNIC